MTLQMPGQKWLREVNVEDSDSQVLSVSQPLSRLRHLVEQHGSV